MNVTHVSEELIPTPEVSTTGDRLSLIYGRQRELMDKYHGIEARSGLLQTGLVPVDIHSKQGQARIKDFAWRVTEEIAEATSAFSYDHGDPQLAKTHGREEISDAFHFMVELLILADVDAEQLTRGCLGIFAQNYKPNRDRLEILFDQVGLGVSDENFIRLRAFYTIEQLGLACNCLKNKPWKQSHMLTDVMAFKSYLYTAFLGLCGVAQCAGMDHDDLFRMYFKKSEVNKFRQRSQY